MACQSMRRIPSGVWAPYEVRRFVWCQMVDTRWVPLPLPGQGESESRLPRVALGRLRRTQSTRGYSPAPLPGRKKIVRLPAMVVPLGRKKVARAGGSEDYWFGGSEDYAFGVAGDWERFLAGRVNRSPLLRRASRFLIGRAAGRGSDNAQSA